MATHDAYLVFDPKLAMWKVASNDVSKIEFISGSMEHAMAIMTEELQNRFGGEENAVVKFHFEGTISDNEKGECNPSAASELEGTFPKKENPCDSVTRNYSYTSNAGCEADTHTKEKADTTLKHNDNEPLDFSGESELKNGKECVTQMKNSVVCQECGTLLTAFNIVSCPDYISVRDKHYFYMKIKGFCPLCGRDISHPDIDAYNKKERDNAFAAAERNGDF